MAHWHRFGKSYSHVHVCVCVSSSSSPIRFSVSGSGTLPFKWIENIEREWARQSTGTHFYIIGCVVWVRENSKSLECIENRSSIITIGCNRRKTVRFSAGGFFCVCVVDLPNLSLPLHQHCCESKCFCLSHWIAGINLNLRNASTHNRCCCCAIVCCCSAVINRRNG